MVKHIPLLKSLLKYDINTSDSSVRSCHDFLFEDGSWVIRYLAMDTRKWLPGRQVLISPISIRKIDPLKKNIRLDLTKKQIKGAPSLESDPPVSRQYKFDYNRYYSWSGYWIGAKLWGLKAHPKAHPKALKNDTIIENSKKERSSVASLRSVKEVSGYQVNVRDDTFGQIQDFLINTESWYISYLVIDAGDSIPGAASIIVAPNWVDEISWVENIVSIRMTREQIESSPQIEWQTQHKI